MTTSTSYIQHERDGKQVLLKGQAQLPSRKPHQSLVKVQYVAQNPTDVQTLDSNAFGEGTVLGCDFVGTVEEEGTEAKNLSKGDVIAGLIWGAEIKGLGAYGSHTFADDRISFKVPKSVKLEDAATLPLASCTAWLALFSKTCLNIARKEGKEKTSVLIWGGSSSVGSYAIQLARIYNFNILTTCSPRNFDMVKKLGATHVFDYNDPAVIDNIKRAASDLEYTFDTIGSKDSSAQASQAIRSEGGVLCTVRPGKANTENVAKHVKTTDVLVWTAFLKDHQYKEFKWPVGVTLQNIQSVKNVLTKELQASVEDHELSAELFEKLPSWLEDGTIKPNNVKLFDSLDSIHEGFDMHRNGKISSFKIVYKV
ncbi:NAD(P)-binding protein [Aureobasidium pullulans]|uniref:NAD(P)-binding protein n=1 Tax=Aureobasidium pullulans TaxID=5580 RepID=A0A4S9USR8_AURPU|nr:NAD(P)-binding protein [Aureobasidium pullulans]THZ41922.1 NAD(P)-binding protein [Aureobasidium pullulans]THZ55115.1 NAD(P)-binding protein [Aureobasidium pullulans]THZ55423.1 NAD(P)-binding protein [Aureobasidium pullulans]